MELAEVQQLTKDLGDTRTALEKQRVELKEAHTLVMKAHADGVVMAKETKDNIDKALTTANETGAQVKELAQKLDDAVKIIKAAPVGPITLRQELQKSFESTEQQELHKRIVNRESKGTLRMVAKATIGMSAVASIAERPYTDTLVSLSRMPLRIRDLLTVIPITTESVRYAIQNVRNNNAAIVAEGAAKPYSDYGWTESTMIVQVIAHLAKLSLQAIADVPRLVAEVEQEMRYGLALKEEAELLNGTGTGTGTTGHLNGLFTNATEYLTPTGAATGLIINQLDRLRMAQLQLQLAYATPDGQVLNPVDVANIELLRRDSDTNGGYIFGNPDAPRNTVTLWGVPTVQTPAMIVGDFLMGAFGLAASLYQREGVTALISTENADDFEKNLATMRVEERLGLAIRRPWALVRGKLGTAGAEGS